LVGTQDKRFGINTWNQTLIMKYKWERLTMEDGIKNKNSDAKSWLDHFERWFDIALRFGWVLFIYVVVTGNYIR